MVGSAFDRSSGEGSVLSGHSTFGVRYLSNSFILAGLIVTVGVGVVLVVDSSPPPADDLVVVGVFVDAFFVAVAVVIVVEVVFAVVAVAVAVAVVDETLLIVDIVDVDIGPLDP